MSVIVIPITTEAPPTSPMLTPGHVLSGRERGAVLFREKLKRELMFGGGPKRTSDHLLGYRHGWDAAVAFLRAGGELR